MITKEVKEFTKKEFKKVLANQTQCIIQRGWCCGTCFFSLSKRLNNQDWQSLLLYRGSYKIEDLNNLPKDYLESINKIWKILNKKREVK